MADGVRRASVWMLGIAIVGCSQPVRPPKSSGVALGQSAPEISANDLNGESMRLSDFRGKVVLVDFWQTHCPPCKAFHSTERALVSKFGKDKFVVLGVNLDDNRKNGLRAQQSEDLPWRSFHDADGLISMQWKVSGTPTVYLIDPEGVIRFVEEGAPPRSVLEQRIEKSMKGEKKS